MDSPAPRAAPPVAGSRVVAVIRALRLDAVMAALAGLGARDVYVEQVRGYGRQKDHLGTYTLAGADEGFLPKVRVEFVTDSGRVGAVIEALREAACTGRIGDGKIFMHGVGARARVGP